MLLWPLFVLLCYLWPVFMLAVGAMVVWTIRLHLDFKRRAANEDDVVYSTGWKVFLAVLAITVFTPPIFVVAYGNATESEATSVDR